MNLADYMANPRGYVVKRYLFEVLQQKYSLHEEIIDRIGATLITNGDIEAFNRLIAEVYSIAYQKCVNDHKEQLIKLGLQVNIVAETKT